MKTKKTKIYSELIKNLDKAQQKYPTNKRKRNLLLKKLNKKTMKDFV